MKIKELMEKVTAALHGDGRLPRSTVFESITDLSQTLLRAKDAHREFERALDAKDCNWPLDGNLLRHGRDGSETSRKANSAWHELAVTVDGRRRTIIRRMLRYLFVTATLFYYSRNIASTTIRTLLGCFF